MGERITTDDVERNIEKAFDGWLYSLDDEETEDPENPGEEVQDLNAAHAQWLAFLKQVEADQKRAESVLASFNLARHALFAIHELIERGDPWRNPEVLEQIKYAVEDALALAEAQPAN